MLVADSGNPLEGRTYMLNFHVRIINSGCGLNSTCIYCNNHSYKHTFQLHFTERGWIKLAQDKDEWQAVLNLRVT